MRCVICKGTFADYYVLPSQKCLDCAPTSKRKGQSHLDKEGKKCLSVAMSSLIAAIDAIAKDQGRSRTALMREAIMLYLEEARRRLGPGYEIPKRTRERD